MMSFLRLKKVSRTLDPRLRGDDGFLCCGDRPWKNVSGFIFSRAAGTERSMLALPIISRAVLSSTDKKRSQVLQNGMTFVVWSGAKPIQRCLRLLREKNSLRNGNARGSFASSRKATLNGSIYSMRLMHRPFVMPAQAGIQGHSALRKDFTKRRRVA